MSKYFTLIRILAALILIIFLLLRINVSESLTVLKRTNLSLFFLATVFFLIFILISNLRWQLLLQVLGVNHPTGYLFSVYLASLFFNNILPTAIGGDVVRIAYTGRKGGSLAGSFSCVFIDRAIGFIGLFFFALAAAFLLYLKEKNLSYLIINSIGLLLLIFILALLFSERFYNAAKNIYQKLKLWKIGERLERIHQIVKQYRNSKWQLFLSFLLSLGVQLILSLVWFFSSQAVGSKNSPLPYFLYTPLIGILTMIPITVGGLGIRENSFVYFFKGTDLGDSGALSVAILFFLINLFFSLIGGICFLFLKRRRADDIYS